MYSKTDISQYIFISHGNFGRLCQTRRPCLKTADQKKQKKNLVFYKKTILLSFRFLCWSWFVRHNPYVPSWIGGSLIILFSGVHNQKPQCWWNDLYIIKSLNADGMIDELIGHRSFQRNVIFQLFLYLRVTQVQWLGNWSMVFHAGRVAQWVPCRPPPILTMKVAVVGSCSGPSRL